MTDKANVQFNVAMDFYKLLKDTEFYPDYMNTFELVCGNEGSKANVPFTKLIPCQDRCKMNFDTLTFSR